MKKLSIILAVILCIALTSCNTPRASREISERGEDLGIGDTWIGSTKDEDDLFEITLLGVEKLDQAEAKDILMDSKYSEYKEDEDVYKIEVRVKNNKIGQVFDQDDKSLVVSEGLAVELYGKYINDKNKSGWVDFVVGDSRLPFDYDKSILMGESEDYTFFIQIPNDSKAVELSFTVRKDTTYDRMLKTFNIKIK